MTEDPSPNRRPDTSPDRGSPAPPRLSSYKGKWDPVPAAGHGLWGMPAAVLGDGNRTVSSTSSLGAFLSVGGPQWASRFLTKGQD